MSRWKTQYPVPDCKESQRGGEQTGQKTSMYQELCWGRGNPACEKAQERGMEGEDIIYKCWESQEDVMKRTRELDKQKTIK